MKYYKIRIKPPATFLPSTVLLPMQSHQPQKLAKIKLRALDLEPCHLTMRILKSYLVVLTTTKKK